MGVHIWLSVTAFPRWCPPFRIDSRLRCVFSGLEYPSFLHPPVSLLFALISLPAFSNGGPTTSPHIWSLSPPSDPPRLSPLHACPTRARQRFFASLRGIPRFPFLDRHAFALWLHFRQCRMRTDVETLLLLFLPNGAHTLSLWFIVPPSLFSTKNGLR